MKKHEIRVGGLYSARVSGNYVTVRVDAIRQGTGWHNQSTTLYDVTNLHTGRKTTFRSAAKFRREATTQDRGMEREAIKAAGDRYQQLKAGAAEPQNLTEECVAAGTDWYPKPKCKECGAPLDADFNDGLCRSCHFGKPNQNPIKDATANQDEEGEQSSDPTPVQDVEVSVGGGQAGVETKSANDVAPLTGQNTGGSLAARIAAQASKPTTNLTAEQQDILATAKVVEAEHGGQRVLVIAAGAGTGKTYTLKQLEMILAGIGQYTAFNSSLCAESKSKFTKAAVNTTHSLAFRAVGRRFAHRLNGPRVKSYQIAAMLGIEDYYVELPESIQPKDEDGRPATRRLKAAFLAGQVTSAIRRFCQSADREVGRRHLHPIDGIDTQGERTNSDKVRDYLLPFAQKAWADLSSETGRLPFSHDVYVKVWQLGTGPDRPVIAADYILLDEAQDTAEVMLDILRQQKHALLILVGDDNQQIYEWRGAVNAMASFRGAPRRLLSQSFRFGQAVADVANAVLATLEEPTDLVMRGLASIPTRVCEAAKPRCYLYRTNAGAIGKLMQGMDAGKRGHLIGGTAEVVAFCRAAIDLQKGNGTTHQELGCFSNWAEVQEYVKEDEGADLKLMVKLVDEFTAERIIAALENMPREEDADFVTTTAHRSKGREWSSVQLGPDFPLANKLSDADRRLVYVAATRAQEELDLSKCPTFCGGYDKKAGGEPDVGSAEWVPGLKITYTTPMPTAEELAAYRAAKSAPAIAPAAPAAPVAPVAAQPAPVAAAAKPAMANGNGESFTWANMDGQWLVRGRADMVGERVTVTRKNGTTSQEMLRSVARKIGELWFYAVR